MKKTIFSKLISTFLFATLLSSCEMLQGSFQKPVKEFFKEYTENAVIEVDEMPDTYKLDSNKLKAYASNKDLTLNFILRNPQNYALNFSYSFDNSLVAAKKQSGDVVFVQSEDKNSVTLTFSQRFLNEIDKENIGGKNLSGKIQLYEPKTDRYFEPHHVSLTSNTVPPQILGAVVMLYKPQNGSENYMLCFNMPKLAGTIHEKDTKAITLTVPELNASGRIVYTTKTFLVDAIDSGTESGFSLTAPASGTLTPSSGGSFVPETNGYTPVYYNTGLPLISDEISYTLTLIDDYGLSSTALIGNKTPKLNTPSIKDASGNSILDNASHTFIVDEDTGVASIFIRESGISTYYKVNEETGLVEVDSTKNVTGADISWRVLKEDGTEYISGTDNSSVEIKLPTGKYTIQASESKLNNVSSELVKTAAAGIIMKTLPKYYVSSSGDDENTGKRTSPFRTIQKAIDEIEANNEASGTDTPGVINLMSDIQITAPITFKSTGGSKTKSYILAGYNGKRKISYAAGYSGRIVYVANDTTARTLTLQNLDLSGNTVDLNSGRGGVAYFDNTQSGSRLTVENCTISNNTISNTGSGGLISVSLSLVISNCVISGNKANVKTTADIQGGLFYAKWPSLKNTTMEGNAVDLSSCEKPDNIKINGTVVHSELNMVLDGVTLKNNNVIKGTYVNTVTSNGVVHSGTNYEVSGKNTITGNFFVDGEKKTASNIYLKSGKALTVDGDLSGSKIGVTTADAPAYAAPVNITTGFGAKCGTTKPSAVFTSDQQYVIGYNGTEAAIAVSSAAIEPELYENIEVRCGTSILYDPSVVGDASGRTVSFKVYDKSTGKDVTDKANLKFTVKYLGSSLGSEYVTKNASSVVFNTNVGIGFYYITVEATVNGTKYISTHPIEIKEIPLATEFASAPVNYTVFGIASQDDMGNLAVWVQGQQRTYTVYLLKDITLSNFSTISKSSRSNAFTGTFDGNGHTITVTNVNRYNYQGLFYKLGANTTIKNLTMAGDISVDGDIGGFVTTNPNDNSNIRIENCVNKMNITSSGTNTSAAGFVNVGGGDNNKVKIINCLNIGNIKASNNASGIANTKANIYNCKNTGSIISDRYAGGITYDGSVYSCVNRGNVSATMYNAGGISVYSKIIKNCINYGTVEGKDCVGGIVGFSSDPEIKNCINLGKENHLSAGTLKGAIIGNWGGSSSNLNNNYFDSAANEGLVGIGSNPTYVAPYAYPFTADGYASTVKELVTIGSFNSIDVVSLLNEWVKQNPAAASAPAYSLWTYDEDGLPKLMCEE
ncbi:MAG: hypothetical protein MJ176_05585 [Treponema sp.]|nr:hypothetical protein [Treponema sp.]